MSGSARGGAPAQRAALDDSDLVDAMRKGAEWAWPLVLERYSRAVHAAARAYAGTCHCPDSSDTIEDAASSLYLWMAQRLRESILRYYRGECGLRTWVFRLVGDRRQVIKAFLMRSEEGRHRADTRLPRLIRRRGALDQAIYRRLVWGKGPAWIGCDLGLTESAARARSEDILEVLRTRSPRVYRRIMANRRALQPKISLDKPAWSPRGGYRVLQIEDDAPLPDVVTEQRRREEWLPDVERLIARGLLALTDEEMCLLVLAFDHRWSLADIVARAQATDLSGIQARHQADYRITRAVRTVADHLCDNLRRPHDGEEDLASRDEVVASLKALFRERGVLPFVARPAEVRRPREPSLAAGAAA